MAEPATIVTEKPGSRPDLPHVNLPPAPMPQSSETFEPLEIDVYPLADPFDELVKQSDAVALQGLNQPEDHDETITVMGQDGRPKSLGVVGNQGSGKEIYIPLSRVDDTEDADSVDTVKAPDQEKATSDRPLLPGELVDNPDGTQSSEITITEADGTGRFMNVPTLWMTDDGIRQLDWRDAIKTAKAYEAKTGLQFPRFATSVAGVNAAKKRSAAGGVLSGPLARQPGQEAEEVGVLQSFNRAITPRIVNEIGKHLTDAVKQLVVSGPIKGVRRLNEMSITPTIQLDEPITLDGGKVLTELNSLADIMDYIGSVTGMDWTTPVPKTFTGTVAQGFGQLLPAMIPLINGLKALQHGRFVSGMVGGWLADVTMTGQEEAEMLVKGLEMLPEDWQGEWVKVVDEFIHAAPGGTVEAEARARLVGGSLGLLIGPVAEAALPIAKAAGKMVVAAKDAGLTKEVGDVLKAFMADKSGSVKLPGGGAVDSDADNKWGLMPRFRQAATVQPEHTKPLITAATNTRNAARQAQGLDDVIARHPEPFSSEDAFTNMWADALGDTDVPIPPYRFMQMAKDGRLHDEMLDLTPEQTRMADDGLEFANDFASLYKPGSNAQADAATTAKLTLWGMLSRGVSPSIQEAGFLDAVNGVEPFVHAALAGKFDDKMLAKYLTWAKGVIKKGSFGRGTQHNLNSFGTDFLRKMGAGEAGNTPLQQFHDLLSDPSVSSKDVRRRFYELADDPGINNKVLSFMMLLAGRKDVVIIDRVQAKAFFDDGRFDDLNLWDGEKVRTAKGKLATKAGTSLAEIFKGHRGLLLYEQIEAELTRQLPKGVTAGEWHWKTWVKRGNQEADHASLLGLIKQARGEADPYVGAKAREGRFGTWNYGFTQVKTKRGFNFEYPTSDGTIYTFTKDTKEALISDIKKRGSGVIPKGFSVQKAGKEGKPWTEAEGVDRGKLDELIRKHGRKSGSTQSGDGAVPAPGEGRAASGPGSGRGREVKKKEMTVPDPDAIDAATSAVGLYFGKVSPGHKKKLIDAVAQYVDGDAVRTAKTPIDRVAIAEAAMLGPASNAVRAIRENAASISAKGKWPGKIDLSTPDGVSSALKQKLGGVWESGPQDPYSSTYFNLPDGRRVRVSDHGPVAQRSLNSDEFITVRHGDDGVIVQINDESELLFPYGGEELSSRKGLQRILDALDASTK